jgi:hypothetical protein
VEIRSSTWQFAILEMIHLLGLTMLLGTLWASRRPRNWPRISAAGCGAAWRSC